MKPYALFCPSSVGDRKAFLIEAPSPREAARIFFESYAASPQESMVAVNPHVLGVNMRLVEYLYSTEDFPDIELTEAALARREDPVARRERLEDPGGIDSGVPNFAWHQFVFIFVVMGLAITRMAASYNDISSSTAGMIQVWAMVHVALAFFAQYMGWRLSGERDRYGILTYYLALILLRGGDIAWLLFPLSFSLAAVPA